MSSPNAFFQDPERLTKSKSLTLDVRPNDPGMSAGLDVANRHSRFAAIGIAIGSQRFHRTVSEYCSARVSRVGLSTK